MPSGFGRKICRCPSLGVFSRLLVPTWPHSLAGIGWISGVYGFVWGIAQFFTGHWSDHIGRKYPIVIGMWLCGAIEAGFVFTAFAMLASGAIVLWLCPETHPRLNPGDDVA